METINISVLGDGFVKLGGGIEFIRLCLTGLSAKQSSNSFRISILIPEDSFVSQVKSILGPYKRLAVSLLKGRVPVYVKPNVISKETLIEAFRSVCPSGEIVFYKNTNKNLLKCLAEVKTSVVFPVVRSLGPEFPYPWIGYIYDFQHKYYPGFFDKEDIVRRDIAFDKTLTDARVVIVNSKAVKNDIEKFCPNHKAKVFSLPFCPITSPQYLTIDPMVVGKYNIPNKYFIISNQFWVHKAHNIAFEALSLLHKRLQQSDINIVCTGATYDHRCPGYLDKLKSSINKLGLTDKIHFLGYIPKKDQISLMQKSIAVLQPTLFEGGPGGGSVYDAVAYNVPAIASDIPINREIDHDNVVFFKANSPVDLAAQMLLVLAKHRQPSEPNIALSQSRNYASQMGDTLLNAISCAMP